jgi:phosphopantetheinyl transferase
MMQSNVVKMLELSSNLVKGLGRWRLPPVRQSLALGEVHLWRGFCTPLELPLDETFIFDKDAALLTPREMERAGRLATATLRRRYVQAHCLLHTLLAAYTGIATPHYELAYGKEGKPYLATPELDPPLHFNMSHAGEMVVIAFARGSALGVDVEVIRPLHDLDALLGATCNAQERESVMQLAEEQRPAAFLRLWTRKEALLKLRGTGLSAGLAVMPTLEQTAWDAMLFNIPFGERDSDYVGTVAVHNSAVAPCLIHYDTAWARE